MAHFDDAFRIHPGHPVRLEDVPSDATGPFRDKVEAEAKLQKDLARLSELQQLLYASGGWAVLVILQGMDAAGKDGVISHVMSGLNPQGVQVHSFKEPSREELAHDFLWRSWQRLPPRGDIGIFNRSYYEEALVPRVDPEVLTAQRLPDSLVGPGIWAERFESINALERHLVRNGVLVLKFFLHISRKEQKARLLKRLDDPAKNWKFSDADLQVRKQWDDYQRAYEAILGATSTAEAPWYAVPADHKWFARAAVADILIRRLEELELALPKVDEAQRLRLLHQKELLEAD